MIDNALDLFKYSTIEINKATAKVGLISKPDKHHTFFCFIYSYRQRNFKAGCFSPEVNINLDFKKWI